MPGALAIWAALHPLLSSITKLKRLVIPAFCAVRRQRNTQQLAAEGAEMFDPKCLDLARHFLSDLENTKLVNELAQHIQDEVEIWLESEKRTLERERKKRQADER
jgi:hypothetical protein